MMPSGEALRPIRKAKPLWQKADIIVNIEWISKNQLSNMVSYEGNPAVVIGSQYARDLRGGFTHNYVGGK